jgi:alpha-glucosidase
VNTSVPGRPWWATAVFYQIYPRSFADGNGDGTGDLRGVRDRLDYLQKLGVDALWLSPFYRSPMADGGYDVSDPCDVDPLFGTLADFDALLSDAHQRGLRVTIDLVPNHLSAQHPWFVEALAAPPGSAARDRFIFRPGRGADGADPPNNWPSVFGGPAWTRVADGEWYLHLFAPEQPDLNWDNPEVPAEFERIMRFWLDRGVDGFRIDVAHAMAKEPGLPDLDPSVLPAAQAGATMPSLRDLRWDRDGVHAYHRMFRKVLDAYPDQRMAVGEAWVADPERLARYVRPDELNLAFNFELTETRWDAGEMRAAITRSMAAMAEVGAPCTWALANHDVPRIVTRFGGGSQGVARARAAALMQLSLPGVPYIYNGDELGLPNAELPDWALQDPTWERSGHTARGRDAERVPLPWRGSRPPFGFTTAAQSWLPIPADWGALTVAAQDGDPDSTLSLYHAAIALRRSLPDLTGTEFEWMPAPADVLPEQCLSFRRGSMIVLLNAGEVAVPRPDGELLLSSGPVGAEIPPATCIWVRG